MKFSFNDKTLALAGLFQSVQLVYDIARKGEHSDSAFESILEPLFKIDSQNVTEIFGSKAELRLGLNTLIKQLSASSNKQEMEITRYVISLLHLEKQLKKNTTMLNTLSDRLDKTHKQMDYFNLTHENVIASLGSIYQDTISHLKPRILVHGEQHLLSQTQNTNKVRALLLAGIRCAVLWRQLGGNRIELLLKRKKYLQAAEDLL